MWILNKRTGVKWEIIDTELIERLKNDKDYEDSIEEAASLKKKPSKKEV